MRFGHDATCIFSDIICFAEVLTVNTIINACLANCSESLRVFMQAMPVILCMSTNIIDMWTGLVINVQGNLIYEAYC